MESALVSPASSLWDYPRCRPPSDGKTEREIVDFYHGRIEARSRPDEGTTFTVWLPISAQR
jgi:hypothetical protein